MRGILVISIICLLVVSAFALPTINVSIYSNISDRALSFNFLYQLQSTQF